MHSATRPLGLNLSWFYLAWLRFLIRYRRTFLGPVWLIVSPTLFIIVIGTLYSHVSARPTQVLIPHLAAGLLVWALINGFVRGSTRIFPSNRAQIMQSDISLFEVVMGSVFTTILVFLHQLVVLVGVLVYFRVWPASGALLSLLGLALLVGNGIWVTVVLGIVGARYRDVTEVVAAFMRIAFLATPIIWMPDGHGRGRVLGAYLLFNPFYHFLELVRAPLLGEPIHPSSWIIVLAITAGGALLGVFFYQRFARLVPLWI